MYMMYDMVVKFSFERKLCDGFWFLLNEIIYIYKFSLINFYWEPVEMKKFDCVVPKNGQKIVVYRKWLKPNYLSLYLSLTFELWMDCIHNAAINNATNVATEVTPWTLNINEKYFTLFVLVVAYWNAYWMKSQKV